MSLSIVYCWILSYSKLYFPSSSLIQVKGNIQINLLIQVKNMIHLIILSYTKFILIEALGFSKHVTIYSVALPLNLTYTTQTSPHVYIFH